MRRIFQIAVLVFLSGCVTPFTPETEETKELLVVEGLITDQPGPYTVKVSKSVPFGKKSEASPLSGCFIKIDDNFGNSYFLTEEKAGVYFTDSSSFRGQQGRTYRLYIEAPAMYGTLHYESDTMEMTPVPVIDSVYYEKVVLKEPYENYGEIDGCQIYLDSYDPTGKCRYFRWNFDETWILRLLWPVKNIKCWVSDTLNIINTKSTAAFNESRIIKHPLTFVSNTSDRLSREYSISVNQYSLSENEYLYWEKIRKLSEESGGLYDVVPSSVHSNISCIENPDEKVLGYFSVSSMSSKRIFIKDNFQGLIDQYPDCPSDTVWGEGEIWGEGISVWVLNDSPPSFGSPRRRILTEKKSCADCTTRGTTQKPSYWTSE